MHNYKNTEMSKRSTCTSGRNYVKKCTVLCMAQNAATLDKCVKRGQCIEDRVPCFHLALSRGLLLRRFADTVVLFATLRICSFSEFAEGHKTSLVCFLLVCFPFCFRLALCLRLRLVIQLHLHCLAQLGAASGPLGSLHGPCRGVLIVQCTIPKGGTGDPPPGGGAPCAWTGWRVGKKAGRRVTV